MEEVMSSSFEEEDINAHYFEVRLEGINPAFPELLDQDAIYKYLASVAAVDFDSQHFPESSRIKAYFQSKGYDIPCYKIRQTGRNKPIYKLYTRSLSTGMQQRTRTKDYIKSITFVDEYSSDGKPLYIGWLAITDFSGQISDDLLQGIRIRKGNILVGDNTTFSRFFPSEGNVANKMFAGEIHVLHPDIIPNAKRDDFEPGEVYQEFQQKLTNWADYLNRTYRRGSSKVSSAIRNLEKSLAEQQELESQVRSGAITSDTKRDKFRSDLQRIQKTISSSKKEIEAAVRKGIIDPDRKETVNNYIKKAEKSEKDYVSIDNAIVNADYATKNDLPSSYSKDERKVYQRVIEVIDNFFADNPEIASKLREAIKAELSVKKK
jgi:molecular chaperone HtpG